MKKIYLPPGGYFVGDASHQVQTLLGSCVSITLWQPKLKVGAMSHFLLARRGGELNVVPKLDARYGEEAMWLMLRELERYGVRPEECRGKIFGGANMFPGQTSIEALSVGRKNGEAARELLLAHHIPVASESLFGIGHRQIIFNIATGDVWARQNNVVPAPVHELQDRL
jgi:chemotaxis protein CheD